MLSCMTIGERLEDQDAPRCEFSGDYMTECAQRHKEACADSSRWLEPGDYPAEWP
jgi:hypothetical protein